jgi:hypothetical protein
MINKKNKESVLVISNFHEDNEISRTNMAYKYFLSEGYDVTVLYSNFSHSLKKFRYLTNKDFVPLRTISYGSSLSLRSVLSYIIFSYRVFTFMKTRTYNIVYVNLPPNILTIPLFYPRTNSKKIVDIIDLWPESFPNDGNIYKRFIVATFGNGLKMIRRVAINKSDYCIAESNLFYKKLNLKNKKNSKVVHLKKFQNKNTILNTPSKNVSIVYLGNIGDIYDFDSLFKILTKLRVLRSVHLHVIGLGPKSDWFFENIKTMGIDYTYYGASFDERVKGDIISKCWFGFNGYKKNTEVALSYKSIDYLSYGVPLINSAKEDTENLVNTKGVGFNFDQYNIDELVSSLSKITYSEIIEMKKVAHKVFQNYFSGESYFEEMNNVIKDLK